MASFRDCTSLELQEDGSVLSCRMFTSAADTEAAIQVLVVLFSVLTNLASFAVAFSRSRSKMLEYPLLLWNILAWQTTNTFILGYLLLVGGVTRFLFHIFGVHTFLEWLVSITMEVYVSKQYRWSSYRAAGILLVVLYAFCHEMQIIWEPQMMRLAFVGLWGYVLDGVGLVFSVKFAWQLRKTNLSLGLYCLGAFGGHAFAIVGSLMGCMVNPDVHRALLFGFSIIQNICSFLTIHYLVFNHAYYMH